jgi:hypothetical protein
MAPHWCLIQMIFRYLFTALLLLLFAWSCSSTEPLTDEDEPRSPSPYLEIPEAVIDEFLFEELDEFEQMLFETRSSLADQFAHLEHDMPEEFTREIVRDDSDFDEYAGFRVQILSTRDVVHADTTRDNFMAWADTTLAGYQPESYVFFRQPYYRVRAGDFHNREMAIEFSRMLKPFFPDAWVVHDRVEPGRVPADTVEIRFREPEDELVPLAPDTARQIDSSNEPGSRIR